MDADAKAREYEITSADPAFAVKPMAEWLDLPRLAKIIQPSINQLVIKNRKAVWKAMSFGGVVYCTPDYVRDVLKLLAFEKKVLDYRLASSVLRDRQQGGPCRVLRDTQGSWISRLRHQGRLSSA